MAGIMTWVIAGSVFVVAKIGIREVPPWTFCLLRVLISALVLVPLVAGHYRDMIVSCAGDGWRRHSSAPSALASRKG